MNAITYDGKGNIDAKTGVGSYSYGDAGPHAVTGLAGVIGCPVPNAACDVSYGLWNLPVSIAENGYGVSLDYGGDGLRRHTRFLHNNLLQKTVTRVSGLHEVETTGSATRSLDYVYAEGRVVAVHVSNGNADSLYYVLTDRLGSWEKVMDDFKNTVQQTHFDPWGNRMSYTAWNTCQTQVAFPFSRGFTGHEHYDRFKIVNANARLYDPVIGRFFSPDPYVQMPDFTQSFNRYSYCMNNPVMYSDPDGEIFGTVFGLISDLVNNIFVRTVKGEKWDWTQTKYGWAIDKGLVKTDPNKSKTGRVWEVVSRLTWQLPQTLLGDLIVSTANAFGKVSGVTYGYGMTVVDMNSKYGAITVGNYSGGPSGYRADWRDHLFVHEYGHYIQSQRHGPLYIFSVAIPSLQSAILQTKNPDSPRHNSRWFEADASCKGSAYFDKYYGSGKEGYVTGSPDFFDRYSFAYDNHSPYINPRTGKDFQPYHSISGKFHWTDIPIYIPLLGLFPYLLYL
jgi:RHS repeat-associated protein